MSGGAKCSSDQSLLRLSQVIDTQRYTVRLYTSSGGVKLIRRHNGAIERQLRLNIGKLPIAYRCVA